MSEDYDYICGCRFRMGAGYTEFCNQDAVRINEWFKQNEGRIEWKEVPSNVRRILTPANWNERMNEIQNTHEVAKEGP